MLRNIILPPSLATHLILRLPVVAGVLLFCAPVSAETLKQALSSAYTYNPSLEANRAEVRAIDENVSIANGRFRPTVTGTGSLSWQNTTVGGGGGGVVIGPGGVLTQGGINRSAAYGISISQPIFTGFQITNQLRAAEAGVRGAREGLRDTERNILMQAVTAYVSVLGAQEALKAQEQGLARLEKEVRIAKERVALTELTSTDLSQAELRRSGAVASVATSRATLKAARAAYLHAVGHEPSNLSDPSLPAGLPKALAEAQAIAGQENPLLVASLYSEEAARHTVEQIRGQLLPQITLEANWGDDYNTNGTTFQRDTQVQGRMSVPLYEGGQIQAAVRQAKHVHVGRIQTIEAVRSFVQQSVSSAWSQLEAAKTRVELGKAQIRASEVAMEGVRKEETIGQRALLDVLNAEQDVVNARVAYINAKHDVVIASYEVLSQIGRLSADEGGLGTAVYDPTVHYEEVRRKWFGLDITHADGSAERVVVHDSSERKPTMK